MRADVKIDEIWLCADLDFIFNDKTISAPEPKLSLIEIPGTSQVFDLTETISGDVEYEQRKITIVLKSNHGKNNYYSECSKLANLFHGKKLKIIFSKDPGFYWIGRIAVSRADPEFYGATFTITAIVDPYKYKIETDQYDFTVTDTYELVLTGSRKRTCPVITVDAAMTVTYLGNVYNLAVGDNVILDIFLGEGDHVLTFTGTGTVNVVYDGGSL